MWCRNPGTDYYVKKKSHNTNKMSLRNLKSNRTRYKCILDKELAVGKGLIEEDRDRLDVQNFVLKLESCINRLSSFCDKLESTNEKISLAVAGTEEEDGIEDLLTEDGTFITSVIDCRDTLITLEKSLLADKTPSANSSTVTVTEDRYNRMENLQLQMQQLLIDHQTMLLQQTRRQQNSSSMAKLPRLDMPTFNGDRMKWAEFWDTFETTIDKNDNLSDVEKLKYLNSKLLGEAKLAVSGIQLSNENYKVAVDLLKERFGDKQTVINAHYTELMNLISANNSTRNLRFLYDQIEKNLRGLQALDQNINQDVFVSIVTSKIPKDVLFQLEIQKGSKVQWSVDKLRELFKEHISARERAEQQNMTEHKAVPQKPTHLTTEALVTGCKEPRSQNSFKTIPPCRFCNEQHWSDECQRYPNLEARKQKIKGCCNICLKPNHRTNECVLTRTCHYCGRANAHHRSLCPKRFSSIQLVPAHLADELLEQEVTETKQQDVEETALISSGEMVLMQTAKSHTKNPCTGIQESVRILFDSGSQRTYITENLAKKLNLKLGKVNEIALVTFGSEKAQNIKTPSTVLELQLRDGTFFKLTANVIPSITGSVQRRPFNADCLNNWNYLWKENSLADTLPNEREDATIDLLIGNDYYLDLILPQKVQIQPGLYMLGSKLGWILTGRTSELIEDKEEHSLSVLTYGTEIERETNVFTCADKYLPIKPNLEEFWRLETIGIQDKQEDHIDEKVLQHFNETLQYENGRYMVTWPWMEDKSDLPDNHGLALGRLKSLVAKMCRNPALVKQYGDIIDDQLKKGVIEKVPNCSNHSKKHYIPHHAVVNPAKATTKMRIVYDASAKTKKENKSLNECLHKGPVLLHDLVGILLRFRLNKIALVSDAFLQVGLTEDSRDVTRFLWLKNKNTMSIENNIQEYRFCRVPFGIISSPFLLAATLEYHLRMFDSLTAQRIKENIYVDNVITGSDSVDNAIIFYNEAKHIFERAGMNLRDWASNSKEVINKIPEGDKTQTERIKLLGLSWILEKDHMSISCHAVVDSQSSITKRIVLKQIASAFDPLGVFSPVILRGKLFLQTLWNENLAWDEKLSPKDITQWFSVRDDLQRLPNTTFPRYIGFLEAGIRTYKLLVFCDASQLAYAAAVYLYQECKNVRKVDLIFSKTRLAPNKNISIPRLELLATVIGTRCLQFVQKELKMDIAEKHIWLDSQCVLCWLDSNRPLNTFVENRIKEIKQNEDVNFHYIPSKENPADIATRGVSTTELQKYTLWWNGPDWLVKPNQDWPVWYYNKDGKHLLAESERELKRANALYEAKLIATDGPLTKHEEMNAARAPYDICIDRFSSLTKLLRVTALVARFIAKLKKVHRNGQLESSEILNAEQEWIAYTQVKHFKDTITSVKEDKRTNLKSQLGLFLDKKGLLRCGGRLENADICESARNPLLLPKQSKFTDLIIESCHKKALHAGVAQTLGLIRHRYWIPHGRSSVKAVLRQCTICRRHEGGPYTMPMMPPLPKCRVSESVPFTYTGIDYFGPMFIKNKSESQKTWICLFTCLVTRAVHLELLHNMSAEQFLLGFRRFISRHGKPKEIISDNAMQFKLASDTLENLWRQIVTHNDVCTYVANEKIKWKFITEFAPWMGGFYERMVGLVKRTLRKAIGKARLTSEQLLTVVKEAEAVVNSRPIVYAGDDIHSHIMLTPAHFLTLNPNIGLPDLDDSDDEFNPNRNAAEKLLDTWKKGLKLLNKFWQIWRTDYLLSLRERTQMRLKEKRVRYPYLAKVGDVVLIKDDLPRGNWRLGKINELITSGDGEIRTAKVMLSSNKLIGRPLNLLYPIECPAEMDIQEIDNFQRKSKEGSINTEQTSKRTKRQAAIRALDRIKRNINDI